MVSGFEGTWKVTLAQTAKGRTTIIQTFPSTTVHMDKAKGALIVYGANPDPVDPPFEHEWPVDIKRATFDISTTSVKQPMTVTSVTKKRNAKVIEFNGPLDGNALKTVLTYERTSFVFETTATKPDGSALFAPVTMRFVRIGG